MGAIIKPGTPRHSRIQDGITIDGEFTVINEETNDNGGQPDRNHAQDESRGEVKRIAPIQ
ncbi:hypothetical protein HOU67_gp37 [Escherichia phage Skarpretter]|uniref:Uncharacterized protein n=1 Tax=Escherichia phage Skarpretter TaxID=2488654 RepID=A0A3G8F2X0_9CAUD|nr:hypothetical protein HOU67_gp37 [Escherichia phage Skarpretter]AZF88673.1 hypothetical protein [Escherichia phage Skarpretter]